MPESVQHKLDRIRPPRVQITYDVEIGGAIQKKELPFVAGILADLSGAPTQPLPKLRDRKFVEITPDNFDAVMNVNLRGTLFLTQAAAKAMLKAAPAAHPRSIVTITSVSAALASPERADYCVSKAGLSMAMRNFSLRLAPHGIAVFEVRPGIIRTDMTAPVASRYDEAIGSGLVPMSRWGEPADIGDAVAGLASGRFAFATGSVISADGGLSLPRL